MTGKGAKGAKGSHKKNDSHTLRQDNPFRVLGVAMIVDKRGVGARLLARYPTQPSIVPNRSGENDDEHTNDDLFFTLGPRQMAKLFRTKKSLCGQPMTLTVNGTVFCCRAVLMHGEDNVDETSTASDSKDQLALFSVIVALSSPRSHTSIPFSSGWEGITEDQSDLQKYLKEAAEFKHPDHPRKATNGRVSAAFLSIRRVHLSLARFCRVLEREETRCRYVSLQANQFFRIHSDRQKKWEEQKLAQGSPRPKRGASEPTSSSSVISSKTTQTTVTERRSRHIRGTSISGAIEEHLSETQNVENSIQDEQEKEQEILELMLAASPPENSEGLYQHHGNLVRELVQVFHSLSRNDHEFPPTPSALLSERDGVVYVNQHIAIPIEAASLTPSQTVTRPTVRPYHTLLFPHASPSELLQTFQSSGSAAPQRLQQLLLTVNAQKPLTEIAVDANLPLYTTMEIASYLIAHGACVTSPVVSRQSRLACLHIEKIPELSLEFSQTFANVDFFRLVSFLTSAQTLGSAMSVLTNVESEEGAWLRKSLVPSGTTRIDLSKVLTFTPEEQSPTGTPGQTQQLEQPHRLVEELQGILYAMAIWLLSHRVLAQMQEYLVVAETEMPLPESPSSPASAANAVDRDESLFRELLESNVLNGDISIMALSWRLGLNLHKVRSWGLRHNRIRVVCRIPTSEDDWEAELS